MNFNLSASDILVKSPLDSRKAEMVSEVIPTLSAISEVIPGGILSRMFQAKASSLSRPDFFAISRASMKG